MSKPKFKLKPIPAAIALTISSYAYANSEKLVNPANNHAYQRLDSALDWNVAKSVCSNMGAHLATITSATENTWITTNFTNGVQGFWLGATDEVVEGTWKWITNETWSYTNWVSGQPDNDGGNENYLQMFSDPAGTWNDCGAGCVPSYVSTYLCEWEPTPTINVYSNDFSTSAGAEWTDPTIATSNGEKFLGTNEYGFGAGSNTLTLNNLPTHTKVTVDFDLYIIQSWDGNGDGCHGCGPDNWQLTADSSNLLLTNFANYTDGSTQVYPNQLSPYGSGGSFAPRTGAFENGHLGFGTSDFGDATYRLSYTFEHTAASVALKFTSMQNQAPDDEGWGLDNVRVNVTPPPVALPVVSTNLPSVVTATTAKLSGTVNPKGAVTTASFDFGTTTSYGTNIVATPSTIPATAGATAISADQTGLNCGATYLYRAKGINSAGTSNGADKAFTTGTCPQPINGACGTANGSTVPTIPTANLCSVGTASAVTGSGPWNWSCAGSNGGTTASCSANVSITSYTVTPSATTVPAGAIGGSFTPEIAQTVTAGATTSFVVTAATNSGGYTTNPVVTGTCPQGSWGGTWNNVWTTGPINANCTVLFGFTAVNSWLALPNQTVIPDEAFTLDVTVKSNSVKVGIYNFVVTFDPTKLRLDTAYQDATGLCVSGICPGTSAVANRVSPIIDNDTVTLMGNDPVGKGPGNDLQLLVIHFKSRYVAAAPSFVTAVSLKTNILTTVSGDNIGTGARGATVNVSTGLCGDVDGNTSVNIVDALGIARKVVGMPPPPTVEDVLADVNKDNRVAIGDALQIARYSIGLQLPPEVCRIGQAF